MQAASPPPRQPLAETVKQLLVGMLGGAALGGAVAVLLMRYPPRVDLGAGGMVLAVLAVVALFPVAVALHEAGHLLGGVAVGFRTLLFVVGPLQVARVNGRFAPRLRWRGMMVGGLAVCVPTDTRDLRRRTMALVAGGPLASLVAGAALLAARAAVPAGAGVLDGLLLALGTLSLFLFVIAVIPGTAGGFHTDGGRFLRLMRGGPDVEREAALMVLLGALMGGERPREWNPEVVARAAAGEADSIFAVAGRQMAALHAMDLGEIATARAWMDEALGGELHLPPQSRPALLLDAAYFAARHDRDPARARALLNRSAGGLLIPDHARPLVEAAVLWAEGDGAAARPRLDAAEAALAHELSAGSARLAADQIADLRALIGS
jgi:hypothetical protein